MRRRCDLHGRLSGDILRLALESAFIFLGFFPNLWDKQTFKLQQGTSNNTRAQRKCILVRDVAAIDDVQTKF
jgi:hypothetical protein